MYDFDEIMNTDPEIADAIKAPRFTNSAANSTNVYLEK